MSTIDQMALLSMPPRLGYGGATRRRRPKCEQE